MSIGGEGKFVKKCIPEILLPVFVSWEIFKLIVTLILKRKKFFKKRSFLFFGVVFFFTIYYNLMAITFRGWSRDEEKSINCR